ncbi:DNA (cytosine-5-)-methyltransferase [Enterococcus casseliflavus]|uniref:DNA cytosine methyltransferase n=1 Tax=Enterococcus casseliflavus TaxID=37734 RepID=UPI000F50E801|nr:DNA (cytosine-5-)-methyltransferase [Enterococcus casseliflavus]NKD37463.1 DNA cytosine methyltransferase [Enterococcus casseliflavus]ROY42779.1 DNA (cytosine-5-)-methyltransferase [Enterococcus casseliflavus]
MLTSIDLFSGPGGLATGFRWAGIKPLIAVEWSDHTVQTYSASHGAEILDLEGYLKQSDDFVFEKNDNTLLIHGDIRKVTNDLIKKILKERFSVDTVDVVTGGAPCESFSQAGKRAEEDERNTLFLNVTRIARAINSKMFVFENVKGLFSKKNDGIHGKMFQDICNEFERVTEGEASFHLASRERNVVLLKANDYGVPQVRERIFLVGINNEFDTEFHYPQKTHGEGKNFDYVTVDDALKDLPKIDSGQGAEVLDYHFDYTNLNDKQLDFITMLHGVKEGFEPPANIEYDVNKITFHKAVNHREKMIKRMHLIKIGEGMKHAADRLIKENRANLVSEYFPNKLYAARNRRLIPDKPSFTVTSHVLDEMIHPYEDRGLTPREAARLQSFPDWYEFSGPYVKFHGDIEQDKYEQIGDAIPPLLAYALGVEVSRTLIKIHEKYKS